MKKRREFLTKVLTGTMAASMVVGTLPVTALAVTGSQVAKDGTYTGTGTAVDKDLQWNTDDYDVNVTLKVEEGKISSIQVDSDCGDDEDNEDYYDWAVNGRTTKRGTSKGIVEILTGQDATQDAVTSLKTQFDSKAMTDAVSGATCTADAIFDAVNNALGKADPKTDVGTNPGTNPGNGDETDPGTNPGNGDETDPGTNPGSGDETDPGTGDETDPGDEDEKAQVKYVMMNVPYTAFYEAYNLTDKAVWEVEKGVDAVSTATANKFTGTTGLAKGTYNNGKYIMGVTIPVAVDADALEKLGSALTEKDDYYYSVLDEAPEVYSKMTVKADGTFSFSKMQDSNVNTKYLSVDKLDLNGGYGDYQIDLVGFSTSDGIQIGENESVPCTIYGAILNTTAGNRYGMTALENLWFGTRTDYVEIAWSILGGQGLQRAHGSGGEFYQFDMNGATLSSVELITDLGIINLSCGENGLKLPEYYTGDLSKLAYSITNNSAELRISGVPADLNDVKITVSAGQDKLATEAEIVDGKVALMSTPVDGTSYTVTISSNNFPDITRTVSTPISQAQKDTLQYWIDKANKIIDTASNKADLKEHVGEAEEMIADENATSAEAAVLIGELTDKVKSNYATITAAATLKGNELGVTLGEGVDFEDLENPTFTLGYRAGRNSVTVASGSLSAQKMAIDVVPEADKEYTLTIISDNYQNTTATVKAEAGTMYVTMNVPYVDFYEAYNLTDAAVWDVGGDIDAVSTATTNKFKNTTGLARGTYNDDTNIMGVTIPVAVDAETYAKLNTELNVTDNYYFTAYQGVLEAVSELTVDEDGNYSFSEMKAANVNTESLSVGNLTDQGGYGDYQIDLINFSTANGILVGENQYADCTIYGAILNTTDGYSYGMTAMENLWFGTRTDYVEIAWSIPCGQQLRRNHNRGDLYYQFENMNGATLSSVTLLTSLGSIDVSCGKNGLKLMEYYEGDLSKLEYSITNDSTDLDISGIPFDDLRDVTISVSGGLADKVEIEKDGKVTLNSIPVDGISYTLTISSSNYSDINRTISTPISDAQKDTLKYWSDKAEEILDSASNPAELKEHMAEAATLISSEDATSVEAAELIKELMGIVKVNYPTAEASATLKGSALTVALDGVDLEKLDNPTYTLAYKQGRGSVTLTSGDLSALSVTIDAEPKLGQEYTLTIVSDNYQDIITTVTAEEAAVTPVDPVNPDDNNGDDNNNGDNGNNGSNNNNVNNGSNGNTNNGSNGNTNNGSNGNTNNGSNSNINSGSNGNGTSNAGNNASTGNGTTIKLPGKAVTSKTPKTSDAGNALGWLGLAIASVTAGGFTWRKRKK